MNPVRHNRAEISRDASCRPYKIADDIKHPRVDETTLGFERALRGDMRLSITGIWRDNKNFVNSVSRLDARWTPVTTTD